MHGACRDVATSSTTGYPLWSTGAFMRTGKDRVRVVEVGGVVTVDGVRIQAGDVVVADDDGVVAVPADRWDAVRDLAQRIEDVEAAIVAAALAGAPLARWRPLPRRGPARRGRHPGTRLTHEQWPSRPRRP